MATCQVHILSNIVNACFRTIEPSLWVRASSGQTTYITAYCLLLTIMYFLPTSDRNNDAHKGASFHSGTRNWTSRSTGYPTGMSEDLKTSPWGGTSGGKLALFEGSFDNETRLWETSSISLKSVGSVTRTLMIS